MTALGRPQPASPDHQRLAVVVLAAGGMGAVILIFTKPDFVETGAAIFLAISAWLCIAGVVAHWLLPRRPAMPLIALTCLFYTLFFALPPFFIKTEWWTAAAAGDRLYGIKLTRISTFTAAIVLLGIASLLLGYSLWRRRVGLPMRLRLPGSLSLGRFRALLWLLAAAHLTFLYVPALSSHSSLAQAMAPLGYFAVGMLLVLGIRGELSDGEKAVYWLILLPLEAIVHVIGGLVTPIVLLLVFMLSVFWYVKRRLLIVAVVAGCFVFYVVPLLKLSNVFIAGDIASNTAAENLSQRLRAIGSSAVFIGSSLDAAREKNVAAPILRRMALVVLLQHCVETTPETIPYLGGSTLRNLATNFIPRLLWPDKPSETLGQWFGHTYRILRPDDQRTSMNLPWLVEFYINFGIVGVVLGMALAGVLLACLEQIFLQPTMTEVEIVAGWSLIFRVFYQESNLSLMLGGLLTQAVFLIGFLSAALWLCRSPKKRPVDGASA